jgi:hypothetical protein
MVLDAPPLIVTLRKRTRVLKLMDTLNWWRVPLRTLGDSVGLPKLDMPAPNAPRWMWDTYNRRDVEIMIRAVTRWLDFLASEDMGGFAPTLASQAFRAYRHRFMGHPILIDDHEAALPAARSAYHGGRCEAFRVGEYTGKFTLLDVNSMYPYVMRKYRYPSVLRWASRRVDATELRTLCAHHCVIADVDLDTTEPVFPAKRHGKLTFPVGRFSATLTTEEIRYALKHRWVVKVHFVAAYTAEPLFRAFVSEMYARRLEADKAGDSLTAYLFKILLNSLYGKFGQRGMVWDKVRDTKDIDPDTWTEIDMTTHRVESYRRVLGQVQILRHEPESLYSHPAIAAHVTANARLYLWSLIRKAGSKHVYYSDTDSLLVDDVGADNLRTLVHPTRLGKLKREGVYDSIDIRGAKDYRFGARSKTKGIRKGATLVAPDTYEQEKWSGLRGALRSGVLDMPTIELVRKHLHRSYDKGVVGSDGWVSPFEGDGWGSF